MFQFKQGIRKSLSVAAVFFVLAWTQANAWADEILVSAAASLTDVLKEISTGYQSKSKHTAKFNFGPSNGLARQRIFSSQPNYRRWTILTRTAGWSRSREKICSLTN